MRRPEESHNENATPISARNSGVGSAARAAARRDGDCARGRRTGPGGGRGPRLRGQRVDPAAGVAQDDDRARVVGRRGQRALTDAHLPGLCGDRDVADDIVELRALSGALVHLRCAAVDDYVRAPRVADDSARVRFAVGCVLQPRGENRSEKHRLPFRAAKASTSQEFCCEFGPNRLDGA